MTFVILTFAFAHCKTVCPTLISSSKNAISGENEVKTQLIVITLDPWRDTPSALASIRKKWGLGNNAHVLSGEIEEVKEVHKRYELMATRDESTGDVVHPALVYVIDPAGKLAYTFNNPSTKWLRASVSLLLTNSEPLVVNG